MKRLIALFVLLLFAFTPVFAQKNYSITSRKAIHFYETAAQAYRNRNNEQALINLEKAIEKSPDFIEAWLFKADVFHNQGNTKEEIKAYEKAIAIDPAFFTNVYFNLGNACLKAGEYEKALKSYKNFLSFPTSSAQNRKLAEQRIKNCRFAIEQMQNPVDFHPFRLSEAVNSEYDEYWPSLTADEEVLVFTRLTPKDKEVNLNRQEDFWIAQRTDSVWLPAQELSATINTSNNEGAQSITADGRYMYFTACDRPNGLGRCDIYYSVREGGRWLKPVNLGKPVNSSAWDAQPSISADGRVLYFVSNRKSGKGKMDLWQSNLLEITKDGQQRWSQPVNLSVNTRDNEMSPFIHASNNYLVFASDGREGMGGFDLFKTVRSATNEWEKPINLGYPINTFGDDIGLVINAKGNKAYFSSDRLEGKGKDIFSFDLPVEHQPPSVSWLKGKVHDAETKKPLLARLVLVDLASKDTIARIHSDHTNGSYLICLLSGKEYLFSAEADEYLFYSDHFSLLDGKEKTNPQQLNIALYPIKAGHEIILRNVFFEVDSREILPKSEVELDRLFRFLKREKEVKIEIGGHTDNTGTVTHNQRLSENRAKAVCEYLISKGISEHRLTYKGYGSDKPIDSNANETGRARNRRTDFKLTDKK